MPRPCAFCVWISLSLVKWWSGGAGHRACGWPMAEGLCIATIPHGSRPKEFIFRASARKTKFLRPSQRPRTVSVLLHHGLAAPAAVVLLSIPSGPRPFFTINPFGPTAGLYYQFLRPSQRPRTVSVWLLRGGKLLIIRLISKNT